MAKHSKGNVSVGYKKISELTKGTEKYLKQDYCREIKQELERLGHIETKGNRTYICGTTKKCVEV